MFHVGDKVAHPMHGAGIIDKIETAKVNGAAQEFYVFKMAGGLVLKIPVASSGAVGLRGVVDAAAAERLLEELRALKVERSSGSWNQRYRENLERIKSGDLYEVARVVKALTYRDSERGLSTGERKLLRSAKQILISELVLAVGGDYQQMEGQIQEAITEGVSMC